MKRIIYKCKRKSCGKVRRIEYPLTRAVDLGGGYVRTFHYRLDLLRGEVRAGSESVCICGRPVSGDEIAGAPTSHKCDARCINALVRCASAPVAAKITAELMTWIWRRCNLILPGPNNSAADAAINREGRRVIPVQREKNCHLMTKFWKDWRSNRRCLMPRWSLFGQASRCPARYQRRYGPCCECPAPRGGG